MNRRPKCAFKDCNNRVMKGKETNRLLSVCKECFDSGRAWMWKPLPKDERVCEECGATGKETKIIPDADCLSYLCTPCAMKLAGHNPSDKR